MVFVGANPTLNFVILTANTDPHGNNTFACVAAKLTPGDLALVAFSVYNRGADQALIRREWYDSAFMHTSTKFPPFDPVQVAPQHQPQPAPAQTI